MTETKQAPETPERPNVSQSVIWLQQRTWGGKQNVPATYLHGVGTGSARIRIDGTGEERTVRLKSLRWSGKVSGFVAS